MSALSSTTSRRGPSGAVAVDSMGSVMTLYDDGSLNRSVDATGRNGNRYKSTATGSKGEGATRTAACYDTKGAVIPCKH